MLHELQHPRRLNIDNQNTADWYVPTVALTEDGHVSYLHQNRTIQENTRAVDGSGGGYFATCYDALMAKHSYELSEILTATQQRVSGITGYDDNLYVSTWNENKAHFSPPKRTALTIKQFDKLMKGI